MNFAIGVLVGALVSALFIAVQSEDGKGVGESIATALAVCGLIVLGALIRLVVIA